MSKPSKLILDFGINTKILYTLDDYKNELETKPKYNTHYLSDL